MRSPAERDKTGHLHGEEPIRYRMVFEVDPEVPLIGRSKNSDTGLGEIPRVELWTNEENLFYWLQAMLARMGHKVTRAEAVIQGDGSVVSWKDRNPNEKE